MKRIFNITLCLCLLVATFSTASANMPTRAAEIVNGVIVNPPEGEVRQYSYSQMEYNVLSNLITDPATWKTEMVYCDNDDVYWKFHVGSTADAVGIECYLKGVDKGDVIEFQLPQCIKASTESSYYVHRMKYEYNYSGSKFYNIVSDNDILKFIKNDDGSLVGDVLYGNEVLGATKSSANGPVEPYEAIFNIVMTPMVNGNEPSVKASILPVSIDPAFGSVKDEDVSNLRLEFSKETFITNNESSDIEIYVKNGHGSQLAKTISVKNVVRTNSKV